jgi:uncharacterized protein (TIGR00255 family)
MIRSMTGYGKGSAEIPGLRVTVELRSLNNRFADLKLRLPPELAAEEGALRRALLAKIRRGRVELNLSIDRTSGSESSGSLNRDALRAVIEAARAAREEFGLRGELELGTALSAPDVLRRASATGEIDEQGIAAVHQALAGALDALDAERRREGLALVREILPRFARMLTLVAEVRASAATQPQFLHARLKERIAALTAGVGIDPARLAQEAAFLADRGDITEELVRLDGHLLQAQQVLEAKDGEPVGKRLDFLLQEIHRETNTVNSKSSDLAIARHALDLKSEAEKVREQIQNLE